VKEEAEGARAAILRAAEALAAEGGVLALGVERVAARAGVSKGAFFYHFANKDEMIAALLEAIATRFEAAIEARVAAGEGYARALIAESFAEVARGRALVACLIAAVAVDPALAPRIAERTGAWSARMRAEGVMEERAKLIRLALDGLLLASLFGPMPGGAEYAALRRSVERLAEP
jgi:AcrR family transcriptional regulator